MFFCQNGYVGEFVDGFNINTTKKTLDSSIVNYILMIKNENQIISQKIHAY